MAPKPEKASPNQSGSQFQSGPAELDSAHFMYFSMKHNINNTDAYTLAPGTGRRSANRVNDAPQDMVRGTEPRRPLIQSDLRTGVREHDPEIAAMHVMGAAWRRPIARAAMSDPCTGRRCNPRPSMSRQGCVSAWHYRFCLNRDCRSCLSTMRPRR